MTGYNATAFRTSPFCLLSFQKGLDALVSYVVQVLNLAHSELSLVPFVDGRQALTRKSLALEAVPDFVLEKWVAPLLQERTWLVPGPATDTIHHSNALALDVMCDRKIRSAYVTVHAARRH